jgi:hypothetical protein
VGAGSGNRLSNWIYMRATILPAGVDVSPPIASWIKPSCIKRARCVGEIDRLMKPAATKHSDEYSAEVKSDLVGILSKSADSRFSGEGSIKLCRIDRDKLHKTTGSVQIAAVHDCRQASIG